MALSGNFISFQSIIEAVYRRTGYQQIDINDAVETIGETLRLIGVLPAFKDVTTNGLSSNPIPLEISDYRVQLPSDYVSFKTARKVNLIDGVDDEGNAIKRINSFSPMTYSSDLFYQSTASQQQTLDASAGTYDQYNVAAQYTVTLVGSSGALNISVTGNLTREVAFSTDLETSAANFVTNHAADYALVGITVTSDGDDILFTEETGGSGAVEEPEITNTSGDLNATVELNDIVKDPVIIEDQTYQFKEEYGYSYKINNSYIYTNFETGYIEVVYTAFVTDDHGFPMIPDDQRFIEAIKWSLIELIDYKKYRTNEIPRHIYEDTEQKKAFYIKSAISKASLPSLDEMKTIKHMMLRSIQKTDLDDSYFKYANLGEQRYNHNSPYYNTRFYRR